ncbi:MAG: PPK2 family polyphosphate kinase [Panacagrimonas sp.]
MNAPPHYVNSACLVPFDQRFSVESAPCGPPESSQEKKENKKRLKKCVAELSELQRIFYAHDHHALLLIFQAMDAAGKDSTIRAVLSGVDPTGCQVFSFKRPSTMDLQHDFLWRTARCLPERGRIGVFNRSYYEEVLAVRVHPEYLDGQNLPERSPPSRLWQERFQSIRDHEAHLARNGTVIIKFWLNVSHEAQRQRFLSRLDEPEKHWKFEVADVAERAHWKKYMRAYEDALNETSRPHAPWYAIPADNKPFMRAAVADIVVRTLQSLKLHYPKLDDSEKARFSEMRRRLGD